MASLLARLAFDALTRQQADGGGTGMAQRGRAERSEPGT